MKPNYFLNFMLKYFSEYLRKEHIQNQEKILEDLKARKNFIREDLEVFFSKGKLKGTLIN